MNKVIPIASIIVLLIALGRVGYLPAKAQSLESIIINPDGTITPPTAPITQNGNTYTLTGNIYGNLTIQKSNIIFDGAAHTIRYDKAEWYALMLDQVCNVTVKNVAIIGTYMGIHLNFTNNSKIINNTISNNRADGIFVYGDCSGNIIAGNVVTNTTRGAGIGSTLSMHSRNNTIVGNKVIGNLWGIQAYTDTSDGVTVTGNQIENNGVGINFGWSGDLFGSPFPFYANNQIYYNNFVNNSQNVANKTIIFPREIINIWNNGTVGNYWSNYKGTDANGDGIGDTPYIIDESNQDHYPLMSPVNISMPLPNPLPSPSPPPTPTSTPIPSPSKPQSSPTPPPPSPSPTTTQQPTPSTSGAPAGDNSGVQVNVYWIGAGAVAAAAIIAAAVMLRKRH